MLSVIRVKSLCLVQQSGTMRRYYPLSVRHICITNTILDFYPISSSFYWVCAPYPLKPSANFHSVGADLESLILTPSSVIVATWYYLLLSEKCFQNKRYN